MFIVAFIENPQDAETDPHEIHLEYDIFPMKGELIIHDDVRYKVTDRYIISHSEQPKFRAARVQYTLHLEPVLQPEEETFEVTQIQVYRDDRSPGLLQARGVIRGEDIIITVSQDPKSPFDHADIEEALIARWKQINE